MEFETAKETLDRHILFVYGDNVIFYVFRVWTALALAWRRYSSGVQICAYTEAYSAVAAAELGFVGAKAVGFFSRQFDNVYSVWYIYSGTFQKTFL